MMLRAIAAFMADFRAGMARARAARPAHPVLTLGQAVAARNEEARARIARATRAWAANNEGSPFYSSATARILPEGFFWKRDALPGGNLAAWPEDRYAWRIYRAGPAAAL